MTEITIPAPVDMHVHFRQGALLTQVVHHHDKVFEYALAMPNTDPPIRTGDDVRRYRGEIEAECERMKPLMTVKLLATTTPDMLEDAKKNRAIAVKLYPEGVTTNSEDGITHSMLSSVKQSGKLRALLGTMQDLDLILCIHGEMPGEFCMDRERAFLYPLRDITKTFPRLRIVMEHITTRDSVLFIKDFERIAATITLHHLAMTLDDVIGDKLQPHNFCKPIAKTRGDLQALRDVVLSQHPRFFFGSDSAPHYKADKECASGCAGCFTAPILLQGLAHTLSTHNGLPVENLGDILKTFTSDNARSWYGLTQPSYEITMCREEYTVPQTFDGLVPWWAGRKLKWRMT